MGRLVITHSSYIVGLVPILKNLSSLEGIKTITPGVIARANSKSTKLRIHISCLTNNGFKLIARKGSNVQEVFIVTKLEQNHLEDTLKRLLA